MVGLSALSSVAVGPLDDVLEEKGLNNVESLRVGIEMDAHGDWGQAGFAALGEEECFELLSRETFGRVGITLGSLPVVLPVNYHFPRRGDLLPHRNAPSVI
jgi:hypothetical protein